MVILYGLSAGLGLASAFLLLIPGLGWIAAIVIAAWITVSVLIEIFKDNKAQDWLKRCYLGKGPEARYPDVETEMAQFERAAA